MKLQYVFFALVFGCLSLFFIGDTLANVNQYKVLNPSLKSSLPKISPLVPSNKNKLVSVLVWWGYLDKPWVKKAILKKCHVKLTLQTYRDADDFHRNFQIGKYDLVIFESSMLRGLSHELKRNQSRVNLLANDYIGNIKKEYIQSVSAKNWAYFYLSNITFLYNPKNILVKKTDTINSIFERLKKTKSKKYFVLIDDPVTISALIKSENGIKMTTDSFHDTFNYKKLVIANDFNAYNELGVFVTWSGISMLLKKRAAEKGVELKIQTIPKYSFVTADILAQLNPSKESACVASLIGSKDFMERLQESTYYYSPYMTFASIKDSSFRAMYDDFYQLMLKDQLQWLLPTKKELNAIQASWEQIILDYGL